MLLMRTIRRFLACIGINFYVVNGKMRVELFADWIKNVFSIKLLFYPSNYPANLLQNCTREL